MEENTVRELCEGMLGGNSGRECWEDKIGL